MGPWLAGVALTGLVLSLGYWISLIRGPKKDVETNVEPIVPIARNVYGLAMGATALVGFVGISLLSSTPYQSQTVREDQLPQVANQIQNVIAGRQPLNAQQLKEGVFVRQENDGTMKVVYVKALPDGQYAVRAVPLDKQGIYTGATTPETRVPFLIRDPNSDRVIPNPAAEAALEAQMKLVQVANSPSLGSATERAAALALAASQSHTADLAAE